MTVIPERARPYWQQRLREQYHEQYADRQHGATRREILRANRGKPFAGEFTDVREPFRVTNGIIYYTGHLPGVQSSIGTPYPMQAKKAAIYITEREKIFGQAKPCGDETHDHWGNAKFPDRVRRDIANIYLSAMHPEVSYDSRGGIGRPAPLPDGSAPASEAMRTFFKRPATAGCLSSYRHAMKRDDLRAPPPRHICGYTGFQPGRRHIYGEPFNRVDCRLTAARQAAIARVPKAEPQSARFLGGYEVNNLIINNRKAVPH